MKFVKGENFITIEDLERLTAYELRAFIKIAAKDPELNKVGHLSLLIRDDFPQDIDRKLMDSGFSVHDTLIFVRKELAEHKPGPSPYCLKTIPEVQENFFKKTWKKCMKDSFNSAAYLNMDEQMESVKKELGEGYERTCQIAYEGEREIGVVMPHIEPDTQEEGRLFYFGLLPEFRGRGKSVPLYNQALTLLKAEFGAAYAIGATSLNNLPMRRVFQKNGCETTGIYKVFKRTHKG
ncbi:GNAT family N-acetyltransferase [Halobacillus salinarum]|uniref:GNAT family N-acetyltransferase n=1 Tax=Halobacillus salinarum TaxID=2932257 RepID=A0ABY4EMU4_9BACI|nr:GNAT family N-acetyltransferase [Halobacillus salinarum]UOQ45168.1 GNAT family N-acetyltransferase [Halobacillus salinarum]